MSHSVRSLFRDLPRPETGEVFEDLLRLGSVQIERIVSSPFPDGRLYDQEQDEWVLLLDGEAMLWVEGEALVLKRGDHLLIPAHARHKVIATSSEPRCVWLVVHCWPHEGVRHDAQEGASDPEQKLDDQ